MHGRCIGVGRMWLTVVGDDPEIRTSALFDDRDVCVALVRITL